MLEQEVTARSEDAPKPRRSRAEARESGTAEIADWRSFRVFNLKLRQPTPSPPLELDRSLDGRKIDLEPIGALRAL